MRILGGSPVVTADWAIAEVGKQERDQSADSNNDRQEHPFPDPENREKQAGKSDADGGATDKPPPFQPGLRIAGELTGAEFLSLKQTLSECGSHVGSKYKPH